MHTMVEVSYTLVVLVVYSIYKNESAKPASGENLSRSSSHTVVEVTYEVMEVDGYIETEVVYGIQLINCTTLLQRGN